MNILKENRFYLFIWVLVLFIVLPLSAQEKGQGLIFSEVYLDEDQPGRSWVEVYNPADKPLVLLRLRLSHIRALNVLPDSIQRHGGIVVKPNECLVLCANKAQFNSIWGNQVEHVIIPVLTRLAEGGFIALKTKNLGKAGIDAFRYGAPGLSSRVEKHVGSQVLSFSKERKSYSRKIAKTASGISIFDFFETAPTPGLL